MVSLVLFICFGLCNQKVNSAKDGSKQFHFNVTLPFFFTPVIGLNISSINKSKIWSLRYINYYIDKTKGTKLFYFNERSIFYGYQELNEIALMYGINNNGLKTFISSSIGLGYLFGSIDEGMELDGDDYISCTRSYNSIGISLDSEIMIRIFPGFGFGLKSLGHVNKEYGFWNWMAILHYRIR
jgi:hypothetical protein